MPILKPNPGQQTFALQQPYSIKEVLYGGARGGGKTFAGIIWMSEYVDNPRFQGLVIRRNGDDLSDWIERARYMYSGLGGVVTGNPAIIRFPSGAIIRTGHMKDDSTYTKYQGHEYQKILIEELTQIKSLDRYLKLASSCRTSIPNLKPQIFATTNPGGIGHLWVKQRFIDPAPENKPFTGEDGMRRIYIPATIDDNPVLTEADPDYVQTIEALKFTDPALYEAWRHGRWDIFIGQVFKEWSPYKEGKPFHVIPHLPEYVDENTGRLESILKKCKKYIALDWGYNDPTSIHWIAVAPPDEEGVSRMYCYREMSGSERSPKEWAKDIADIVLEESVETLIMPHDTYSHLGGNRPIATQFQEVFDEYALHYQSFHLSMVYGEAKSHQSKINRQALLHEMLSSAPDGLPYLQIMNTCRKLIETLPSLPYSETKPEEIDEDAEDHYYDSLTYALYKILGGTAYVSPSLRLHTRKESHIMLPNGNAQGFSVNISKAIGESMQEKKDWRYM